MLQIPERLVTKNGKPVVAARDAGNAVVGVWSSTERRRLQVTNALGRHRRQGARAQRNRFVQVSRLGNPLVNEVVIPLGQKDRFNRTTPEHDAANYGKFVLKPELAAILNALFGVNAPENNRTDIVQALLQGIPNLNQHSGPHAGKPVDTLKINLGIPPSKTPSRFGVIGGDNAGFPNGRRLSRRRRRHRAPGGRRNPGRQPGAARGRGGPERQEVPAPLPVPGGPDSGFDSNPSQRFEPPTRRRRPVAP